MISVNSFMSCVQENRRIVAAVLCVCLLMALCLSITPAMADPTTPTTPNTGNATDTIERAVESGAEKIYNLMRAIVIPIIIVMIAWAGLQFAIGGAKGTESAMKIFKGCCGAVIFVVFAPIIGQGIGNMFKDSGSGTFDSFNSLDNLP